MSPQLKRCLFWLLLLCASACTVEIAGSTAGSGESQTIKIDGSSTVAPISSAVAETFEDLHPDIGVRVNTSGTGGGFDRFSRGETDGGIRTLLQDQFQKQRNFKTDASGYDSLLEGSIRS